MEHILMLHGNFLIFWAFLALFAFIILAMPAFAGEISPPPLEKTGRFTAYCDVVTWLQNLPQWDSAVTLRQIGETGKVKMPVFLVKFNDGKFPDDKKVKVLFVARVHGSEPAGMEALLQFLYELVSKKDKNRENYLKNFTFYMVVCANPEGSEKALGEYRENGGYWSRIGRDNGDGIDVNRDFQNLKSAESRILLSVFNEIRPDMLLDMHEYSSKPLLSGLSGWWRRKYFDVMIGAGRHPDCYGPLADYANDIFLTDIQKALKSYNYRVDTYAVESGDADSTGNMAVNGADYFNLRNCLTFLIETGSYDEGESTIKNRRDRHLIVLRAILARVSGDKGKLKKLTAESARYASTRREVTLGMKKKPRTVNLDGTPTEVFKGTEKVNINGKDYYSAAEINFTHGDPENCKRVKLPQYYLVFTVDKDMIERLMLHGMKIYKASGEINMSGGLPAPAFLVPTAQESSAIIGLILDERAYNKNRWPMNGRYLVVPVEGEDGKNLVPLQKEEAEKIIDDFCSHFKGERD